jgi:hypothetical protein
MPDKRDMHKAKSHRNSKSSSHQPSKPHGQPSAGSASVTTTSLADSSDSLSAETSGKKNKSKR